jgi:hypothetical protein
MKRPRIISQSVEHLRGSQTTYAPHFRQAFYLGWILILNGLSSIVHAVIPAFFPGTAAFTTMRLFYKYCHGHPNPQFQRIRSMYEKRYVKHLIVERTRKNTRKSK